MHRYCLNSAVAVLFSLLLSGAVAIPILGGFPFDVPTLGSRGSSLPLIGGGGDSGLASLPSTSGLTDSVAPVELGKVLQKSPVSSLGGLPALGGGEAGLPGLSNLSGLAGGADDKSSSGSGLGRGVLGPVGSLPLSMPRVPTVGGTDSLGDLTKSLPSLLGGGSRGKGRSAGALGIRKLGNAEMLVRLARRRRALAAASSLSTTSLGSRRRVARKMPVVHAEN